MLLDPATNEATAASLRAALLEGDPKRAASLADQLSYHHTARIVAELPMESLGPFLAAFGAEHGARILGELPPDYARTYLLSIDTATAAGWLERMPTDRAAAILGGLAEDDGEALMAGLRHATRERIDAVRAYPPGSAGSVMTPEYLAVRRGSTIRETMSAALAAPPGMERASYVYVIDGHDRPLGVLSFKDLYRLPPEERVEERMTGDVVAIHATEAASRAARMIRNRRLTMLPVIDDAGRMLGVIPFNDAMDLLAEDIAEQFTRVGTSGGEESFHTRPLGAVRLRLPWMVLNVFLNLGAVWIIAGFEATIAQVAILAAFLPMITDMGGNVGIQALSVAIRSIALDEVRLRDLDRAVRKEAIIGVVNGLALGVLFGLIAWLLEGNAWIGAVAGFALAINVLLAGTVGGCLPFILKRLGRDPAMMTGPLLTTVTDITGVSVYLGLSTLFIVHLAGG